MANEELSHTARDRLQVAACKAAGFKIEEARQRGAMFAEFNEYVLEHGFPDLPED